MESSLPHSLFCYPVNWKLHVINVPLSKQQYAVSCSTSTRLITDQYSKTSTTGGDSVRQFIRLIKIEICQNMSNSQEGMKKRLVFSLIREIFFKNIHSHYQHKMNVM